MLGGWGSKDAGRALRSGDARSGDVRGRWSRLAGGSGCAWGRLLGLAVVFAALWSHPVLAQPVLRSAAVAWIVTARVVGVWNGSVPMWPGLALAWTPSGSSAESMTQVRTQVVRAARDLPARAVRPVTRSLRAMLRQSLRHGSAVAMTTLPRTPLILTERAWLPAAARIAQPDHRWQFRMPEVQCDACAASAAEAEAGEDSIQGRMPDVQALTTVQLGNATLKVTSLQPFSLLFKKHF